MWVLPATAEETGIPFARSLIRAQTEHQHLAGSVPTERHFISSHSPEETSAARYAEIVRAHWNIENGSHWQRDTLWREDQHQMRGHTRAHILATSLSATDQRSRLLFLLLLLLLLFLPVLPERREGQRE